MIEAGTRRRKQPAPPHILFENLVTPDRDPSRPWLAPNRLADEVAPAVLEAREPHLVVWSSLWPAHPGLQVRFDLPWDADHQGTDLRWTMWVDELPSTAVVGHLRKRMNQIVNADLRYTFGQ